MGTPIENNTTELQAILEAAEMLPSEAVLYAEQTLTDAQKAQARENIGAISPISPALTGTPTAPTADTGNNSTRIATTAFVKTATNALKSDLENGTGITVKNAEKAGTASGLDTTGINQVKGIKVDDATTADKVAHSLKFGSKTYNGSSEQTITAGDLGLESAIRFVGITATAITDGGTQSPVVDGETHIPIRGDVVIRSITDQEFIWNGSAWEELGNSSSHALKTISISAGSGLTGGGNLEANRTISHGDTSSQESIAASGRRYITGVTLDTYGHVTGLTTGTETVTDTNYYHTPDYSTGLKIATGNESANMYVPDANGTTAGVTVVYPADSCTTFSSDSGTVTPLAVQKGAETFAITRPPKRSTSNPANPGAAGTCTSNNIVRWLNSAGDVQDSKITIEDVTNTKDTSKKAQVIAIPAEGGKKMVYGYCTDQTDGTYFIGGVFDASATTYSYAEGLAIGGTSGNLLWKGKRVATADELITIGTGASNAAAGNHTHTTDQLDGGTQTWVFNCGTSTTVI